MRPALAPYPPAIRRAALIVGLCLAVLIGYFSLVTPGETPAPQISDKLRHFAAYWALAVPAAMWFGPGRVPAAVHCVAPRTRCYARTGDSKSARWCSIHTFISAVRGRPSPRRPEIMMCAKS